MTDINQKILDLILAGKTTTEILETLKISPKQLKIRLDAIKNSGYNLGYNISDDGKVKLDVLTVITQTLTNTTTLKLVKEPHEFTTLVVSDFHIGHPKQNIDRINQIYEYAAKNGINIIINCGDIIDGCCDDVEEKNIKKQIATLIEKHPYDKDILNLVCFGNHDYSALEKYGIDVSKILTSSRNDFISLGFSTSLINIKNGQIIVSHPVRHAKFHQSHHWPQEWLERKVILKGHGHHNYAKTSNKKCIIKVPTLSDIVHSQYATIPGALKLTIELNEKGQFQIVNIETLVFANGLKTAAYAKHELTGSQTLLREDKILRKKTGKLF